MKKGFDNLKQDFDLIVHKLPWDLDYVNIYPIGDLHIGSAEFNGQAFDRWKETVLKDPNGYVVIVGDIMDMATKVSVTNLYESTLTPMQQKEKMAELFWDIKDRILASVSGNHEYRANILTGICPMYDVLCKLNKEDTYRPNMGFIKVNLGERNKDRQVSYTLVLAHGYAKTRTKQFPYTIDGIDCMFTGHFHEPESHFRSKIVVDTKNETVGMRNFIHVSVPSFMHYGGYGMKAMYFPTDGEKFPVLRLDGKEKNMTLHWI